MKKTLIALLLLALLLSPTDARANSNPAYYSATEFNAALVYGEWTYLNASTFNVIQNGVVTLSGNAFLPQTTGLVEVSGTCMLKRAPGNWLMTLWSGGTYYRLIDTDREAASFTVTIPVTPSTPITIWTAQYNQEAANGIRCTLLFKAV